MTDQELVDQELTQPAAVARRAHQTGATEMPDVLNIPLSPTAAAELRHMGQVDPLAIFQAGLTAMRRRTHNSEAGRLAYCPGERRGRTRSLGEWNNPAGYAMYLPGLNVAEASMRRNQALGFR